MQANGKILWKDHKDARDHEPFASVSIQGKVVEYKYHQIHEGEIGGRRGEIREFTDAARRRMVTFLNRVKFDPTKLPLFVTLTYPDECAYTTVADRNLHRKIFARHLERLTGTTVPASWRIEWEVRKSGFWEGCIVPHWHMLIFKIGFIPYAEINRLWAETIGHKGHVQTEIRRVDKRGGVRGYMAKYISKEAVPHSLVLAAYQSSIGRQYGWLRKREIPLHDRHDRHSLSGEQIDDVIGLTDQMVPWAKLDARQSYTLYTEHGDDFRKIIDGEPLTAEGES